MINFSTDMADERRDIFKKANKLDEIPGVETETIEDGENIKTNRVKIIDSRGEEAIGKPIRNLYYNRYKKFKDSRCG